MHPYGPDTAAEDDEANGQEDVNQPVRESPYPMRGNRGEPDRFIPTGYGYISQLRDEPLSIAEVKARPDYSLWAASMEDEFKSPQHQGTFSITQLPSDRKA